MTDAERIEELRFALSALVALVDKNRRKITDEDADTFYLDRNLRWAKEALANNGMKNMLDTERLDWLDTQAKEGTVRSDDLTFHFAKVWAVSAAQVWTLREAIDMIRKQAK